MRIKVKHKIDETDESCQTAKRAKIEDKQGTLSSPEATSLDQTASMDVDTSKAVVNVVVKNPIDQPTLSRIVLNPSLSDIEKITILTARIKAKSGSILEKSKFGTNLLMNACVNGGVELVEWLLQQDKDLLTKRDSFDNNVLVYAVTYANKSLFYYFLEKEPSFATSLNRERRTTLHSAAQGGDSEIFSALLKRYDKPWPKEFFWENNYSILYYAIKRNRFSFIQWLAREHKEFMVSCENIHAAIGYAKSFKNDLIASFLQNFLASKEWCNYLIQNGLHNKPNRAGFYPIHYFAGYGFLDSVELLLEAKVSVDLQTVEGNTTLYLAAKYSHLDIVKLLVGRGANLLSQPGGWHPIHIAAEKGHLEIVDWLLSKKVSANLVFKNFWDGDGSAVHIAAYKGHIDIIKLLFEHKAEINKPNARGEHPVHIAANFNQLAVLKWLLEQKDVSPDQPMNSNSKYPFNPLLFALINGHFDVVEVLKSHKAKYTVAVEKNDEKNSSQEVESKYLKGSLLLAAARDAKALPILKNLLDSGVDINSYMNMRVDSKEAVISIKNIHYKLTALHEAVRYNNIEGVKLLLERKSNLFKHPTVLGGVFALAILSGNVDIFQLLFTNLGKDRAGYLLRIYRIDMFINIIYKKSFPKEIFFLLRQLLSPVDMNNFVRSYLVKFYKNSVENESWLGSFIDLIKQDTESYIDILYAQCNLDSWQPVKVPALLLRKSASLLLKQVLVDEKFFPLLSQNNNALLFKIVRFSKNKEMVTKLLVRMSFNKDFNLMHALLCEARGEGAAAILESLPEEKRKELISHNDYAVFDKVIQGGGIKTFFSLLKELKDSKLENQLIRKHIKFGIRFILTAQNHFTAWFKKRLDYFMNAITSNSERDDIILETLREREIIYSVQASSNWFSRSIGNTNCDGLDCLINWTGKRRKLILSLAPDINLRNAAFGHLGLLPHALDNEYVLGLGVRSKIDILLSRLDNEEDRELFILLIPKPKFYGEDRLYSDFLKDKTQLVRAAAVNKIYQIKGFDYSMVETLLVRTKFLNAFMLTSKNKNFPRLNEDLSLHILTILIGMPPSLLKVVMQAMHIDGINAAKAKGIVKADAKPEEKSREARYYSNSTLFFQRMAVCFEDDAKKTVQKSPDEKMSLG